MPFGGALPSVKDSAAFKKWARRAFDELDMDKTGKLDFKEVTIGILKIYDRLNSLTPAHILSPPRAEVVALAKKYDRDGNGTLEFDEFLELSRALVGGSRTNWRDSLSWRYGSALVLRLVVCPLLAGYVVALAVRYGVPYSTSMPVAPLSSVIEMLVKFVGAGLL